MNPLFQAMTGGMKQQVPQNMQNAMQQLQANPLQTIRNAGYQVPDEIAGDPRATVMHLMQTGQIGGPAMQRIQPMLNMLMGRR